MPMTTVLKVVAIAGTTGVISELHDKSWENVMATLTQNPLLEPDENEIDHVDKLIKKETNAFKFDGSAAYAIVEEVQSWFSALVAGRDEDILESTGINIDVLAIIVASTGACVDSSEAFFAKHSHHEHKVLDIGVLMYPELEHSYFKVYKLQLTAWSDCKRVVMVQEDSNGITGDFRARKCKPRDSVISGLREETRQAAIQEAEALFA